MACKKNDNSLISRTSRGS